MRLLTLLCRFSRPIGILGLGALNITGRAGKNEQFFAKLMIKITASIATNQSDYLFLYQVQILGKYNKYNDKNNVKKV